MDIKGKLKVKLAGGLLAASIVAGTAFGIAQLGGGSNAQAQDDNQPWRNFECLYSIQVSFVAPEKGGIDAHRWFGVNCDDIQPGFRFPPVSLTAANDLAMDIPDVYGYEGGSIGPAGQQCQPLIYRYLTRWDYGAGYYTIIPEVDFPNGPQVATVDCGNVRYDARFTVPGFTIPEPPQPLEVEPRSR